MYIQRRNAIILNIRHSYFSIKQSIHTIDEIEEHYLFHGIAHNAEQLGKLS